MTCADIATAASARHAILIALLDGPSHLDDIPRRARISARAALLGLEVGRRERSIHDALGIGPVRLTAAGRERGQWQSTLRERVAGQPEEGAHDGEVTP